MTSHSVTCVTFHFIKNAFDVKKDGGGVEGGVDATHEPAGEVVVDDGHRLPVVGVQPRPQRVRVVIRPSHQWLSGDLVYEELE